jgi:3-oxo-5alpha-steroid 4-dehydrogenase
MSSRTTAARPRTNAPDPAQPPLVLDDPSAERWDDTADLVVVGFGGAGVCAALEGRERGLDVLVVDRFHGGGATAISGGVFYSGGGTHIQREAGVEDSVDEMVKYLAMETQGVVSEELLREFCEGSADTLRWLERYGVPFEASLCPFKTSYPLDKYYLYYSGNEGLYPFKEKAKPAPRGHRAKGKGLPVHRSTRRCASRRCASAPA